MHSGIIDILKKILDNKFYQTLISVFLTFITYFISNENMAIVKKFGYFWSNVFAFVCWMLIIEIVIIIGKKIPTYSNLNIPS